MLKEKTTLIAAFVVLAFVGDCGLLATARVSLDAFGAIAASATTIGTFLIGLFAADRKKEGQ